MNVSQKVLDVFEEVDTKSGEAINPKGNYRYLQRKLQDIKYKIDNKGITEGELNNERPL